MIKSFKHKGLKDFFEQDNRSGILPHHAKKLQILLTALNVAKDERDMNAPNWKLHSLSGNFRGHWSKVRTTLAAGRLRSISMASTSRLDSSMTFSVLKGLP